MEKPNEAKTANEAGKATGGTLIDTEALNDGLVTFYDGMAKILGVLSNAAEELNKIGQSVVAMTETVGLASGNAPVLNTQFSDTPSATDPDYCIPDEADEANRTTEVYEPANEPEAEKPKATRVRKTSEKAEPAEEPPAATTPPAPQPSVTTFTLDDIIKVIVTKIKLDRKNNEAIGKLVAAYGYSQVRDIPPEKYEAFMNDLAQL